MTLNDVFRWLLGKPQRRQQSLQSDHDRYENAKEETQQMRRSLDIIGREAALYGASGPFRRRRRTDDK